MDNSASSSTDLVLRARQELAQSGSRAVSAYAGGPEVIELQAIPRPATTQPVSTAAMLLARRPAMDLAAQRAVAAYRETMEMMDRPVRPTVELALPEYGIVLSGTIAERAIAARAEAASKAAAEAVAAAAAERFSLGDLLKAVFSGFSAPQQPVAGAPVAPVQQAAARPAQPQRPQAASTASAKVERPVRVDTSGQAAASGRSLRAGEGMNGVFLATVEELIRRSESGRWLMDSLGPDSVTVCFDDSLASDEAGLVILQDGKKPVICLSPTQDIGRIVSTLVHECKHVIDIAATEQAFNSRNPLDHLMLRRVAEGMADTMSIAVALELKRAGVREPYNHLAQYVDTARMIEAYEAAAVREPGSRGAMAGQRAACLTFLANDSRRDNIDRSQLEAVKVLAAQGHFSPASPVSALDEAQLVPFGATNPHGNCWRGEADRLTAHRATLDRHLARDVSDMLRRVHAFGAQHAAAGKPNIRQQAYAGR